MKNTERRDCWSESKGNCVFADYNKHGTECCTIDKIVQTKFFSCTPQDIINKKTKQIEEEELYLKD